MPAMEGSDAYPHGVGFLHVPTMDDPRGFIPM